MSKRTLAQLLAGTPVTSAPSSGAVGVVPPDAPSRSELTEVPSKPVPPVTSPVSYGSPLEAMVSLLEKASGSLEVTDAKTLYKELIGASRLSRKKWEEFIAEGVDRLEVDGDTLYLLVEDVSSTPTPTPTPVVVAPTPVVVAPTPSAGLTILIDTLPLTGVVAIPFSALIAPIVELVREEEGTDPLLVPYNEGVKRVAAKLVAYGIPTTGTYSVSSSNPYWLIASTYFIAGADVVYKGVR